MNLLTRNADCATLMRTKIIRVGILMNWDPCERCRGTDLERGIITTLESSTAGFLRNLPACCYLLVIFELNTLNIPM